PAPVPFEIAILYEDDQLLAIDKPPGLVVHGGPGDTAPSVASWFLARFPGLAAAFDSRRPGVVHRLDKDTTGVLLLAKSPAAQHSVSRAFEQRETEKLYLAVCDGVPDRRKAAIDAPIGRHPGDRTRMAIVKRGRAARSRYEVLAHDGDRSLVLVHLETGRTHQARVHLAAISAPVSGDSVYGHGRPGTRQLLHSYQLTVPHPDGGTLTISSALPADMQEAVRSIHAEDVASSYMTPVPPKRGT
ncbi:MAG: RluA family pseudouridine synthase, partial [Dehalococcoidia bacterium]